MRNSDNRFLSLAAPFLVLLALLGVFQRQGSDRLQSLPALLVGGGLVITSSLGRRYRRQRLLMAIRRRQEEVS